MTVQALPADDRITASPLRLGLGAVLLAVAAGASGMLALKAFGTSLPGCGPDSDCARAAASVWGSIPGLGWPTSHVGLAYFVGLLVAWFAARGTPGGGMKWLVRIGVLGSIGLTAAMFLGGYVCMYCLAAHVANVAFWLVVETGPRGDRAREAGPLPWAALAGVFVIATAGLAYAQVTHDRAEAAREEAALEGSIDEMIGKIGTDGTDETNGGDAAPVDVVPVVPVPSGPAFTGRFRQGPEAAPVRVVIFSDYQCPDCRRVESELEELLAELPQISYSHKHFPMCSDCNEFCAQRSFNPHPNACWAARAAEAAGIIQGPEGFWKMHNWLFEQSGSFTDASLPPALRSLGFEPNGFTQVMMGPQTLANVKKDIQEAIDLGLHFTPMIFVNGVEMKGIRTPNALRRAVEAVMATDPPALTASSDRPPDALQKYVNDWQDGPKRQIPPDMIDWSLGPANAPAQITVWGDYEEPGTASLDMRLRAAIRGRTDVRYSFRHYPVDQSCNTYATRTLHPNACRMSQAAEAAGRLGGRDAYWKMHTWLLANQATFSDEGLRAEATRIGLDFDALVRQMGTDENRAAILDDANAAKRLGINPIPFFWINGRRVPRWNLEGEDVITRLIDEAAKK